MPFIPTAQKAKLVFEDGVVCDVYVTDVNMQTEFT
jgi:hypothetical protein